MIVYSQQVLYMLVYIPFWTFTRSGGGYYFAIILKGIPTLINGRAEGILYLFSRDRILVKFWYLVINEN